MYDHGLSEERMETVASRPSAGLLDELPKVDEPAVNGQFSHQGLPSNPPNKAA